MDLNKIAYLPEVLALFVFVLVFVFELSIEMLFSGEIVITLAPSGSWRSGMHPPTKNVAKHKTKAMLKSFRYLNPLHLLYPVRPSVSYGDYSATLSSPKTWAVNPGWQ